MSMNINILEQLEIDEAKAQSDIAGFEKQLSLRKNDLLEIQIAKKRCAPYLTGFSADNAAELHNAGHADTTSTKRRSLGEIKRKVLEGYYSKRGEFLSNQEVSAITGLPIQTVKAVTVDSKKRNELVAKIIADIHKAQITQHGINRLKESKGNNGQDANHAA
jgi:hypothetical protein